MNMPNENIRINPASVHTGLLINNEDCVGVGGLLRVVNPATEELVAEFPGASSAQVDEAVAAAKTAFESGVWKNAEFRKATLLKFAALIEENRDPLMEALISEVGSPVNLKSNHIDTPAA